MPRKVTNYSFAETTWDKMTTPEDIDGFAGTARDMGQRWTNAALNVRTGIQIPLFFAFDTQTDKCFSVVSAASLRHNKVTISGSPRIDHHFSRV